MLKESTGVILPIPNKTDYTDCASFTVIAVMQPFSKIAETIINNKLMAIAYSKGFYSVNQTGSLPQRSTIDSAILLQHWVKEAQFAKRKMLLLFLDGKGGFDNVDHRKLLGILAETGEVPDYLTNWIQNFVTTRNISLPYPGSLRMEHEVNKGIPQGSPLLPLLFVIYIKKLHSVVNTNEFFTTSYVDDFQITVASNLWERNVRKLEGKAAEMIAIAQSLGLSFSIVKSEVMHPRTWWEKGRRSESSVTIQSHVVELVGKVVT